MWQNNVGLIIKKDLQEVNAVAPTVSICLSEHLPQDILDNDKLHISHTCEI
jgi:hypothetical protein